jgi:hypothetical protein
MNDNQKLIWAAVFGAEFARLRPSPYFSTSSYDDKMTARRAAIIADVAVKSLLKVQKDIEKDEAEDEH